MTSGRTITVEVPIGGLPNFTPGPTSTRIGTARYADCAILERRLVTSGGIRLEYHRTGVTARVWILSESAAEIEVGSIAIATMTDEGYWELTSVMC